jgi:hypothetical protein
MNPDMMAKVVCKCSVVSWDAVKLGRIAREVGPLVCLQPPRVGAGVSPGDGPFQQDCCISSVLGKSQGVPFLLSTHKAKPIRNSPSLRREAWLSCSEDWAQACAGSSW